VTRQACPKDRESEELNASRGACRILPLVDIFGNGFDFRLIAGEGSKCIRHWVGLR
jgi:hypothetical protein